MLVCYSASLGCAQAPQAHDLAEHDSPSTTASPPETAKETS